MSVLGEIQLRKITVEKRNCHANKEMTLSISTRGEFILSASSVIKLKIIPGDKIDFFCDAKNAQKIFFIISSEAEYNLKKTVDRSVRFTNKNLRAKLLSFLMVDTHTKHRFKILENTIKSGGKFYYQLEIIKSN